MPQTLKSSRSAGSCCRKSKTIPPGPIARLLSNRSSSQRRTSAQTAGRPKRPAIETVLLLGRAYESQRDYLNEMSTLLNNLYAGALQGRRTDDLDHPDRIDGVLSDLRRTAAGWPTGNRAALEPSGALVR